MKFHSMTLVVLLLFITNQVIASQLHDPSFASISAKYAKLKAKQRSLSSKNKSEGNGASEILSDYNSDGCDLNVGNVTMDGVGNSPDEVVIIIEGDIFQSNNCR